jgi:hypothetical protein
MAILSDPTVLEWWEDSKMEISVANNAISGYAKHP